MSRGPRLARDRGAAARRASEDAAWRERVRGTASVSQSEGNTCSVLSAGVERRHEIENLRRSLAMQHGDQRPLTADQAYALVVEVQELLERIEVLRRKLRELAEEV